VRKPIVYTQKVNADGKVLGPSDEELENKKKFEESLRMYVIVRRDMLALPNCGVQACHAVAEYVNKNQNDVTKRWVEDDKTLIMLEGTIHDMKRMKSMFKMCNMDYQEFREPDLQNELTAIAFQPIPTKLGHDIFNDFKLLS
jgi:hypothetical protein